MTTKECQDGCAFGTEFAAFLSDSEYYCGASCAELADVTEQAVLFSNEGLCTVQCNGVTYYNNSEAYCDTNCMEMGLFWEFADTFFPYIPMNGTLMCTEACNTSTQVQFTMEDYELCAD